MLEFHVIQGPNTRDARDKIAFFAFRTFLIIIISVEVDSDWLRGFVDRFWEN